MISIRKYLYTDRADGNVAVECEPGDLVQSLLGEVLDAINQHVLTGEVCESERRQVGRWSEALQAGEIVAESLADLPSVSRILADHHEAVRRNATNLTVEVQHMFAMLNQALIVLSEGRNRSVARLNKIQESLSRISMIEDLVALKSRLAETMRFIEAESAEAHDTTAQDLLRLEAEVGEMRELLGNARTEMAGRSEGIRKIEESLQNVAPGEALYLVAFRFDRVHSVSQRYGPAVADELIFRIIKERLFPVAPGNTAYRWTLSSLVAIFRRLRCLADLRSEVIKLNSAPLVHRIALGNRTAVMTLTPSHLVAEAASESPAKLIEQVDLFTGACVPQL